VNVLKLNHRATIETLLERGATQREIARITGIDRKTVRAYQRRWHDARSTSSGVTTGNQPQIPPPWPPARTPVATAVSASLCEPHREFGRYRVPAGAPEYRLPSAASSRRKSASSRRLVLTLSAISGYSVPAASGRPDPGSYGGSVNCVADEAVHYLLRAEDLRGDPGLQIAVPRRAGMATTPVRA
jgi:hypothetical protein